jgi:hypothetical protein
MLPLQAEASSVRTESESPGQSPHHLPRTSTSEPPPSSLPLPTVSPVKVGQTDPGSPGDMLDVTFIGRTIKLVLAENWEDDVIPTIPQETRILYENQRGYLPHYKCFSHIVCSSSESHISVVTPSSDYSNSILQHTKERIPS